MATTANAQRARGYRPRTANSPHNHSDAYSRIHQPKSLQGVMPLLAIASIFLGLWLLVLCLGGRDTRESWQTSIAYHLLLTVVKVIGESTFKWVQ